MDAARWRRSTARRTEASSDAFSRRAPRFRGAGRLVRAPVGGQLRDQTLADAAELVHVVHSGVLEILAVAAALLEAEGGIAIFDRGGLVVALPVFREVAIHAVELVIRALVAGLFFREVPP